MTKKLLNQTRNKEDERVTFILNNCKNKNVLHIGCSDWPYTDKRMKENRLLHKKLEAEATSVIGVDILEDRLDDIRKFFPKSSFILFDDLKDLNATPDIICAGEVIEHVENPGIFLKSLRDTAGQKSKLLLTTPNAQSLKSSIRALVGKEFSHPDHVLLFSKKTIAELLDRSGWNLQFLDYYFAPPTTLKGQFANVFFRLLVLVSSRRIGDGIMLIATPKGLN